MIAAERRAVTGLASIFALRMLGLFLVLPVMALAARELDGATPLMIGLALGVYGLTQALLQVPFGLLSDRFGRKHIILAGLVLFALGSVVCALADSIVTIVIGRALQGSGAIAAALMALAADLTRDVIRTRVMAIIGVSIGASFSASLLIGPLVHGWLGLSGLFWLTTGFALIGMVLLYTLVPTPNVATQPDTRSAITQLRAVVADRALLRLDAGIFVLHLVMTASFVVLPVMLEAAGLPGARHWQVYLPVLLGSVALMVPLLIFGERRGRTRLVFLTAITLVAVSQAVLGSADSALPWVVLGMLVFFTGFNVLEATLPALISRAAPATHKGTALGVYSTAQFAGAFVGGVAGGALHQFVGLPAVFAGLGVVTALWLILSLRMRLPNAAESVVLTLDGTEPDTDSLSQRLSALPGVDEAVVLPGEGVAWLRVDLKRFDRTSLHGIQGIEVPG